MTYKIPQRPENSFRVTLELKNSEPRLDSILMSYLQQQDENEELKNMTKSHLKRLFAEKKIMIKGQNSKASSPINAGTTYIDILL